MNLAQATALRARERRRRLYNPPNAVPDHGIDLKRKHTAKLKFDEDTAKKIQQEIEATKKMWAEIIDRNSLPLPADESRLSCRKIIYIVARHYGVTVQDVCSQRKTANVVRPRQVAAYLCRKLTPMSTPYIANALGKRDHTTIIYATQKIAELIESDEPLASDVAALTAKLKPSLDSEGA